MTSLVYILFENQATACPIIGVYSTKELAEQDAVAMKLKDWYTLTRQYK